MNIKKHVPKFTSVLLSFAMLFSNVLPAYATEAIITESALEEAGQIEDDGEGLVMLNDDAEIQADSKSRYEEIEVNYSQSSSYFVTIPKNITLGADKRAPYSVKVEGDIVANKQVCVVPVDGITDTEVFDFYMEDQIAGSTKEDVVAEVSQAKFYWNHEEAKAGYEEHDNYIVADGLSAGRWKGTFQMEISMRTDPSHIHNYVGEITKEPACAEPGEKTYTCDCGESYTESIDPTGHHYENGECTDCGEKDPDHEHSYREVITKEPTCTEEGEKTYICDCGDSYTEKIPATGHNFIDGECEHCGEKDPDHHEHDYKEEITKEPTCTEAGEKTYTCDCGDSYTEEIPATGHNFVDGECEHCGEKDPDYHKHNYTEEITKEATCTEEGEKTYTCDCGDSYTEKISMTEHHYGDDDKCTECGQTNPNHVHDYEPYKVIVSPTDVTSYSGSTGGSNTTKWYLKNSTDEYDEYYCADVHYGYWYKGNLTLTCNLILPEDYEGTFDYPYYYSAYRNSTDSTYKFCAELYINDNAVYKNIEGKATGSASSTETVSLSAGINTFAAKFVAYNNYNKSTTYDTSKKSNATVRLYKATLYDGSEYHICNACGEKEVHHFVDGVCIECGWHEGDHTHHYVDGVCDKCGKSETQYTLKIDYPDFLNEVEGISSNTQYIQDGDVFELPEKTDDAFDLSGYSIAKAVKNISLCSSNYNTNDAIYVRNIGKCGLDAPLTTLDEFGLTVAEVSASQPWRGTSVPTDYGWKQTAVSDTIVIEKPCVYVFSVNEHQKCDNIYEASMQVSGSLVLEDITNSKSYTLTSLAASTQKTYDYDNVKIRCISKTVSNTSSTGKYDRTYKKTYMIYLNPGEYRLTASGSAGNGQTQTGSCIYSATISSPLGSTSTLEAPVINNVKHTAVGGTLYELIPIENGQEFDFSTMYTNENSTDIYLISNWTAK